jgi:hypothetical protein
VRGHYTPTPSMHAHSQNRPTRTRRGDLRKLGTMVGATDQSIKACCAARQAPPTRGKKRDDTHMDRSCARSSRSGPGSQCRLDCRRRFAIPPSARTPRGSANACVRAGGWKRKCRPQNRSSSGLKPPIRAWGATHSASKVRSAEGRSPETPCASLIAEPPHEIQRSARRPLLNGDADENKLAGRPSRPRNSGGSDAW